MPGGRPVIFRAPMTTRRHNNAQFIQLEVVDLLVLLVQGREHVATTKPKLVGKISCVAPEPGSCVNPAGDKGYAHTVRIPFAFAPTDIQRKRYQKCPFCTVPKHNV
jgi:hypothetical protein